jgi:hypothetical protein
LRKEELDKNVYCDFEILFKLEVLGLSGSNFHPLRGAGPSDYKFKKLQKNLKIEEVFELNRFVYKQRKQKMLRKKLKMSENVIEIPAKDNNQEDTNISEKFWHLEQKLCNELKKINFKSDKNIAAVYNPLDYAADIHVNFLTKFLKQKPKVLFLGNIFFNHF